MGKNIQIGSGIGLPTLLTCIFVAAKLWGKIDWSWWWVFSPLWISAMLAIIILIFVLFVFLIAGKRIVRWIDDF